MTVATIGTVAASGSDRAHSSCQLTAKAAGIRQPFLLWQGRGRPGKPRAACWTSGGRFAKRRPLAKAFRTGSGRIAQLVEQLTLNQRVAGSSPAAPTKAFN